MMLLGKKANNRACCGKIAFENTDCQLHRREVGKGYFGRMCQLSVKLSR